MVSPSTLGSAGADGGGEARPFYGKPYAWLVFALVLVYVPLVGYMVRAGMAWDEMHPAINAMLNGTSTVFLIAGWFAIRQVPRRPTSVAFHRLCMGSAFAASTVFLASYLTRYYLSGTHRYPGEGLDKVVYLIVLFSHMALAIVVLPMIFRALFLAWKGRYAEHRRIARLTWPIWLYVSFTGVVVYLMLYPIAGALYGP